LILQKKINKVNKPLANLIRKKEKTQINKIREEKGDITTNTNEIQRTIREYFENLCSNKLENLDDMGKLLNAFEQPKLNQGDINHLNSSITSNEIEAAMKSLPTKKRPKPDRFTAEFYQTFKEVLTPTFLTLFHEIEKEGTLSNSFYEASIIVMPKSDKYTHKKENYKPIFVMKIDARILNKILEK
jgi:small-conductance mechanosensitive channel